jgi:hypothetical protein
VVAFRMHETITFGKRDDGAGIDGHTKEVEQT